MKPLRMVTLLAILAFLVFVVIRSGWGGKALKHYAPGAYVERANALIAARHLSADCLSGRPKIRVDLAGASVEEKLWYEQSYLPRDIARFEADPDLSWTFLIDDDCRLKGVNPAVHRIELPFARLARWTGRILWRGGVVQALLRSPQRTVTLSPSERPTPADKERLVRLGTATDASADGAALLTFSGGAPQPAARLSFVGEELVIQNRAALGRGEALHLMGYRLKEGRRARLETGDWLHFEAGLPRPIEESFAFVGREALSAASAVRRQNDRLDRRTEEADLGLVTDPASRATTPYLGLVAGSVDNILTVLPAARAEAVRDSFDIQLTLDRTVQVNLGPAFEEQCRAIQKRTGAPPFSAGLTVLDGLTGEVLALATYPQEEDLIAGLELEASARRRLLKNQNLVRHPIGSVGKPFLFAAVAHSFPFLMGLEIDGHAEEQYHRDVLHCEVPKGYHILGGHQIASIDFRTALQISCNKYAVELVTLALAASNHQASRQGESLEQRLPPEPGIVWPLPGRASGVRIQGRSLDYAPNLGGFVHPAAGKPRASTSTAARRCLTMDQLEAAEFRSPYELLTGADTYLGEGPRLDTRADRSDFERGYRVGRYDLTAWAALLEHLMAERTEDEKWSIRALAQEMSPERVNLAFNQINQMRGDYLSLILGGGASLWTNVQLAEAFSRLVTGREVEARLASRILEGKARAGAVGPPETKLPRVLPLRAEARQAVLEGLALVSEPGGTAAALRSELTQLRQRFPDDRLLFFSKTGSPTLERAAPAAVAEAVDRLVSHSRLRFEGGGLVVRSPGRTVAYGRPGSAGRAAFLAALEQGIAEVGYSRSRSWLKGILAELADDFAQQMASLPPGAGEEIDGPLVLVDGQLALNREDRLFRGRRLTTIGAAYVFTLVRLPGTGGNEVPTPEDFAAPGVKVLTVALHLETGPDSRTAVAVAREVLERVVGWLE